MKTIKLDLPAFAFLDGNSPEGDTLENRTVIVHLDTGTILEFFHDEVLFKEGVTIKKFSYMNMYGIIEDIVCAVQHSNLALIPTKMLMEIAIVWYRKYLNWEDKNIKRDINSENN